MATPSIQTLMSDAQQVLNLNSVSEIRATMAAALANANVGTPLIPTLTTQQLWDEFYQIVRQPETDIESIITNQLMKFLYAPPAPGGAGADKQVIFNDGGVLAGNANFLWNKTTNLLTVTGTATITGDLTVDTSTLKVVSASDVVGINTASPLTGNDAGLTIGAIGTVKALNIGLQNTFARLREKDAIDAFAITTNMTGSNNQDDATKSSWKVRMGFGNGNDNFIISRSNVGSTTFYDLYSQTTASAIWYDGAGGTRMTLNSTGLGVGGSPSYKLHVTDNTTGLQARLSSTSTSGTSLEFQNTGTGGRSWRIGSGFAVTAGNFEIYDSTAAANRLSIDSSGNVGVGVTPSAWTSSYKALQIGTVGAISSGSSSAYGFTLSSNLYQGASGNQYITTGYAGRYDIRTDNGSHVWYTSASGVAAGVISLTQAMTLTANGNLLIGTTTDVSTVKMQVWSPDSNNTVYFRNSNATTPYGPSIKYTAATPNNTGSEFLYCEDSTALRASLRSNGGLANYQANNVSLSDSRLKTDIKPLASYWNKIKSLEFVTFKYKDQTHSDDNIGLIAQQVESVAPELIDADGFGETPADGVPLKTIYTTDLYHASIKALQEAMARIEALEAKLA